jgi:hypothetical protein
MKHLIGAGHVAEREIGKYDEELRIYDNNKDLQGTPFHGYVVLPVESLKTADKGEVIICTTSVNEVSAQLKELGINLTIDVADDVREFQSVYELENIKVDLLIASGLPSRNIYGAEGGIYRVCIDGDDYEIQRIIKNPCHGIIHDHFSNNKYITDQHDGLLILNNDLNVEQTIPLDKGVRPHGVSYNENKIIIVCSNDDSLRVIDKKTQHCKRIPFSDKMANFRSAQHHANDVYVSENYAYVSMFSLSGNWKRGLYDGGVMEINLETGSKTNVVTGLKLPHSVTSINDSIVVLNSYLGEVFSTDTMPNYRVNGFLRGIALRNDFLFLGESKNRNSTSLRRKYCPASIDSRITIINTKYDISRSISLPSNISEIHSIDVL